MEPEQDEFQLDFLEEHDAESLIAEMQRLARELGQQTLSARDLDLYGRVSYAVVAKQFGGLWRALRAAGLKGGRCKKATDEELLEIIRELWRRTYRDKGKRPSTMDMIRYGIEVSPATVIQRFGGWKRALRLAAGAGRGTAGAKIVVKRPSADGAIPSRRTIPVTTRFYVFQRDQYRCRMCGNSGGVLEVDHIVPLSQGGDSRLDNLQTLCRDCNRGKGGNLQVMPQTDGSLPALSRRWEPPSRERPDPGDQ